MVTVEWLVFQSASSWPRATDTPQPTDTWQKHLPWEKNLWKFVAHAPPISAKDTEATLRVLLKAGRISKLRSFYVFQICAFRRCIPDIITTEVGAAGRRRMGRSSLHDTRKIALFLNDFYLKNVVWKVVLFFFRPQYDKFQILKFYSIIFWSH